MQSSPLSLTFVAILCTLSTTALADNYRDTILRDKPFAYYRLTENESTQPVQDEMGNQPGTFQNGVSVGTAGALIHDPENKAV